MKLKSKSQYPEEEFQMAPMVDMVFLLLVFFMTVSTLAQANRNIELDLPESEESSVPKELSDRGIISIDKNFHVYVSEKRVTIDELKNHIKDALISNPELKIQIRADHNVPYRELNKILKLCADLGSNEIIYSTYQANL